MAAEFCKVFFYGCYCLFLKIINTYIVYIVYILLHVVYNLRENVLLYKKELYLILKSLIDGINTTNILNPLMLGFYSSWFVITFVPFIYIYIIYTMKFGLFEKEIVKRVF